MSKTPEYSPPVVGKLHFDIASVPLIGTIFLFVLTACLMPLPASAVPAYSRQTGYSCDQCHVGAFGPQLKALGRAFKLGGYTLSNGEDHFPPLAFGIQSSFTHTATDQSPSLAPNAAFGATGPNDNFAIDQVELFWGGQITPAIGAFIQTTYSGISNTIHWDDTDIRYAHSGSLFGIDYAGGITVNNHPSIQDLWNSTPAFGFPYTVSSLAPGQPVATKIDNALAQRVIGAGVYSMVDDWLFLEADAYQPLDRSALNALGVVPVAGATLYDGAMPYWRLALQHDFGDNYAEIGTYGIHADAIPGGDHSAGTDKFTDVAFDANWQWTGNPDHLISAHSTYITEHAKLDASSQLAGANPDERLSTFRADLSYSYKDTLIPTIQHFNSWGSADANYWGTPSGTPNSSGFIYELAFVPFGKQASFNRFYNVRFDLQYVDFTKFAGATSHAGDNNAFYFNIWLIGAFW